MVWSRTSLKHLPTQCSHIWWYTSVKCTVDFEVGTTDNSDMQCSVRPYEYDTVDQNWADIVLVMVVLVRFHSIFWLAVACLGYLRDMVKVNQYFTVLGDWCVPYPSHKHQYRLMPCQNLKQGKSIISATLTLEDPRYVMIPVMFTMTSWHGNAFCVTGPLWGESTGKSTGGFPSIMASTESLFYCCCCCCYCLAVEQKFELPWDAMKLIWCHFDMTTRRHNICRHNDRHRFYICTEATV